MTMATIGMLCRAGFESECGKELVAVASEKGIYGYFQAAKGSGWATFVAPSPEDAGRLMTRVRWRDLVFAREWMLGVGQIESLPKKDRVGAVLEALKDAGVTGPFSRVEVQVPDSDQVEGDVQQFARKFTAPLSRALKDAGWLVSDDSKPRLDLVMADFDSLFVGLTFTGNRSPFLGGRPRLRMPGTAPSRSTLKLEEAWKLFIPKDQWLDYLGGGRQAVDLGAAPGGWTWQLVKEGMLVTAIDNGPMDDELMASGHVTHVRADAFTWRPRRAVDWMVCDIVDKPTRVIELVIEWLTQRLCRYTVFNLKLPMKQRWEEWEDCRDRLETALQNAGIDYRLQAKHLYHDREEISCFVELVY